MKGIYFRLLKFDLEAIIEGTTANLEMRDYRDGPVSLYIWHSKNSGCKDALFVCLRYCL